LAEAGPSQKVAITYETPLTSPTFSSLLAASGLLPHGAEVDTEHPGRSSAAPIRGSAHAPISIQTRIGVQVHVGPPMRVDYRKWRIRHIG